MGEVSKEKTERNAEIYYRRMAGEGPKALGEEYDLCPSRVYKIVMQYDKKTGGKLVSTQL
jgi:Mor family transcriptional regulator